MSIAKAEQAAPSRNVRQWYACYTKGRHEKQVARALEERGFDVLLPLVPRLRQWHDRETTVEFPLFPSYVFARCGRGELSEGLTTPGVVDVVKFDGRPVEIPAWEIESIRRLVSSFDASGRQPEPVDLPARGEVVEVVSGPMKGVRGTVTEQRGAGRVVLVVGVTAIAQGLRVEVDREAVRVRRGSRAKSAVIDTGRNP